MNLLHRFIIKELSLHQNEQVIWRVIKVRILHYKQIAFVTEHSRIGRQVRTSEVLAMLCQLVQSPVSIQPSDRIDRFQESALDPFRP